MQRVFLLRCFSLCIVCFANVHREIGSAYREKELLGSSHLFPIAKPVFHGRFLSLRFGQFGRTRCALSLLDMCIAAASIYCFAADRRFPSPTPPHSASFMHTATSDPYPLFRRWTTLHHHARDRSPFPPLPGSTARPPSSFGEPLAPPPSNCRLMHFKVQHRVSQRYSLFFLLYHSSAPSNLCNFKQ